LRIGCSIVDAGEENHGLCAVGSAFDSTTEGSQWMVSLVPRDQHGSLNAGKLHLEMKCPCLRWPTAGRDIMPGADRTWDDGRGRGSASGPMQHSIFGFHASWTHLLWWHGTSARSIATAILSVEYRYLGAQLNVLLMKMSRCRVLSELSIMRNRRLFRDMKLLGGQPPLCPFPNTN
jgi:hypothetical protein